MSESLNDIVSRIVLEHDLADEDALDAALAEQKKIRDKEGRKEPLERILVDMEILKGKQLKGLRYAILYYLVRKVDRFYGKIAVQSDIVDESWVNEALLEQKRIHTKQRRLVRLNRILLDKEYINQAEDRAILKAIEDIREKRRKRRLAKKKRHSTRLTLDDDDPDAEDILESELNADLELDDDLENDFDDLNEVSGHVRENKEVPSVSDDLEGPDLDEQLTKSSDYEDFDDDLDSDDGDVDSDDELELDDDSSLELEDDDDSGEELELEDDEDDDDSGEELELDDDSGLDDISGLDDASGDELDDLDDLDLEESLPEDELDDSDDVVLPRKGSAKSKTAPSAKTSAKAPKKASARSAKSTPKKTSPKTAAFKNKAPKKRKRTF